MSCVSTGEKLAALAVGAVAVAGAGVLLAFDPNQTDSLFPPCVFHSMTGWFCPGCGMTRALHAVVHGDVLAALSLNPFSLLIATGLPLTIAWLAGCRPAWLRHLGQRIFKPWLWASALPLFWLLRNLPWPPFTLLAPT